PPPSASRRKNWLHSHLTSSCPLAAFRQDTCFGRHTVPVVFATIPDPVGSGFVDSLSQPGRNATGFLRFEYGLSGKWLELTKEIAPSLPRAMVLWDPAITAGIGQFTIIQAAATSAGVDLKPVNLSDAGEVERAITAFAGVPNGGLIVTASALSTVR